MHYSTAVATTLAVAGSLVQGASAALPQRRWGSSYGGSTWSSNGTNTTGSSPQDEVTVVTVGKNGQLAFEPPNVQVPVGSHVQFQFYPQNHSVVQADFTRPCVPISNVDKGTKGFFSGFMPAANAAPDHLVFDIQVTSSDPIWFYCSQDTHCQSGMVGAINAPSTGKTLGAFKAAASKAPFNLTPGVAPPGSTWSGSNGTSPTGGSSPPPPASTGGSTGGSGTGTGTGSTGGTSSTPPPTAGATRIASMGLGLTFAAAIFLL